jgi:hypothetical protein
MKTVQIAFAGPKSEEMAKRFFTYMVDGGLEDQVIEALSGNGATLEISDCNTKDLAVLFQCREEEKKRGSRKGVRK